MDTSEKTRRVYYIDNLRILLTCLVVLHHLAITYGAPGDWYFKQSQTSEAARLALTPFIGINQAYFMGFFFLISAHLTPGSLERKGLRRFLRDRLLRLGIPLLFYTLVINPSLNAILAVHVEGFNGSYLEYLAQNYRNTLNVGPMWFVLAVLLLTSVFLVVRSLGSIGHIKRQLVSLSIRATVGLALALGLISFLVRIQYPIGYWIPWLHVQPAHATQYVTLFAIGILASGHGLLVWLSDGLTRFWGRAVPLVGLVMVATLASVGDNLALIDGGVRWQSFVHALWEQATAVGMIILLLTWFGSSFDRDGPVLRAAAADSYTVYIIHPLIIVILTLAMRDVALAPLVKFGLLAPVALIACFVMAHLVRRLPFTRGIL